MEDVLNGRRRGDQNASEVMPCSNPPSEPNPDSPTTEASVPQKHPKPCGGRPSVRAARSWPHKLCRGDVGVTKRKPAQDLRHERQTLARSVRSRIRHEHRAPTTCSPTPKRGSGFGTASMALQICRRPGAGRVRALFPNPRPFHRPITARFHRLRDTWQYPVRQSCDPWRCICKSKCKLRSGASSTMKRPSNASVKSWA